MIVNRILLVCLLALSSLVLLPLSAVSGQEAQEKEAKTESLLSQADIFYLQGEYQKAIENYQEAASLAEIDFHRSRAYMGLSLCYFYLDDEANVRKWIVKVLEVDPEKEVSSLFYPETFVELFNQIKMETQEAAREVEAVEKAEEEVEEAPVVIEEEVEPEKEPEAQPQEPPVAPAAIEYEEEAKEGRWEVDVHFSAWTMDIIPAIEDSVTDEVSDEIFDAITDHLNASYPAFFVPSASQHSLSLKSSGPNFGVELRFYPLGKKGSMSLGLSYEKTHMRFSMQGPLRQEYTNGAVATVEGEARVETSPSSLHFSFRWDIAYIWRVIPYFVFGLGVGPLNGDLNYSYVGTVRYRGNEDSLSGDGTKTFDEIREEGDIKLETIPIIHLGFGVKAEVYRNIYVRGEFGFWDGFIFRGGVAYRF